jgi:hypothetical protein
MEPRIQYPNNLRYEEVYISDMVLLKNIFLQKQNSTTVNESFGLPFLMVKKANVIIAFACLVVNKHGKPDFIIHEIADLNTEEKEGFRFFVEDYFKRNPSDNYRNPQQLKSTINSIVNWINV